MTNAIIAETTVTRSGVGAVVLLDACTHKRLFLTLHGRLFDRTRDEAMAIVADYAARHSIVIVETQTQTEDEA